MPLIEEEWTSTDEEDEEKEEVVEEKKEETVELGFAVSFEDVKDEEVRAGRERWKIWHSGKVGGRPAWLNGEMLPKPESLACLHCKEPLVFLTQVYAPIDEFAQSYHRVIYVFCCRRAACLRRETGGRGAVRALRCQLPKVNSIYTIPKEESETKCSSDTVVDDEDVENEEYLEELERKEMAEIQRAAAIAERSAAEALERAVNLKESGNLAFKEARFEEAIAIYTKAIDILDSIVVKSPYRMSKSSTRALDLTCRLRCNRCQALLSAGKAEEALADTDVAVALRPEWPKAIYRRIKALRACDKLANASRWNVAYKALSARMKASDEARLVARYVMAESNLECESEWDLQEEQKEREAASTEVAASSELEALGGSGASKMVEEETTEPINVTAKDIREALGPKSSVVDKKTRAFHKRIKCAPDQCLRYSRWPESSAALWTSLERCLPDDFEAPKCEQCGAARRFELQLMPQMLSHLGLGTEPGSADWEAIVVYTCTKSCGHSGYQEAFLWAQTSQKNFMC